jgi:hypothetical protein
MITIEKDIPLPEAKKVGKPSLYPFEQMEVGDSFFIAKPKNTMSAATYAYGKKAGKKFTVVEVEGGSRIWRTK